MPPSLPPHVAALTGLCIWYGVFACLDGRDGLRWLRPVLPLLAGAVCFRVLGTYLATVHPLLTPHLESLAGAGSLLRFIIDVGVREELLKLLFSLPFLLWLALRSAPSSALLAAALVGVGFATAENRWFFTGHSEPTLLVGRVFSTTLLHATATGLCGAALLRAWRGGWQAWARCAATCLIVAAAHGLYDWAPASGRAWLLMGGTSWLSQAVVIALAGWLLRQYHALQPGGVQGRAAALWLGCGAVLQYALALGLTWARWGSPEAVWVCARECALFLPVIAATGIFLMRGFPASRPRAASDR